MRCAWRLAAAHTQTTGQMNTGGFLNEARVVYRSNNNANANGGVSYANSGNDTANANANIGSRLVNNEFNEFLAYSNEERVLHRGANENEPQQKRNNKCGKLENKIVW